MNAVPDWVYNVLVCGSMMAAGAVLGSCVEHPGGTILGAASAVIFYWTRKR